MLKDPRLLMGTWTIEIQRGATCHREIVVQSTWTKVTAVYEIGSLDNLEQVIRAAVYQGMLATNEEQPC